MWTAFAIVLTAMVLLPQEPTAGLGASFTALIALGGAAGASLLLGLAKKYTGIMDGKLGEVLKPVQPILVTVGAFALPLLSQALGLVEPINAAEFVAAPTAAIITIAAREAVHRLSRATQ